MSTGKEIFERIIQSKDDPDYKQIVLSASFAIGEEIFQLLEKAEKEGKRIAIQDNPEIDDDSLKVYLV